MGFCENFHTLLGFPASGATASSAPMKSCDVPAPAACEGLDLSDAMGIFATNFSFDKADCCCYGGGLGLCTESLGSESCDGALEPEEVAAFGTSTAVEAEVDDEEERPWGCSKRKTKREFPPPLRWMAGADGQRKAFLRPERSGGRLILKEVQIDRQELFLVSREGGRLRLHLIREEEEENEEEEQEVEDEETAPSEAGEMPSPSPSAAAANEEAEWEWSAEERRSGEWRRRCQEKLSSSREAAFWWNHHQRFVTTA